MSIQSKSIKYAHFYQQLSQIEQQLNQRHFPQLFAIFRQCFVNTLETTVEALDDATTFVLTGDIPAMWLRDSTAQVTPYLKIAPQDDDIRELIKGLIKRQVNYVLIDAYANAFNKEPNGQGHQQDRTKTNPWVWERKYELDSLCYPIQLSRNYWLATNDSTIFDSDYHQMLHTILDLMVTEQQHDTMSAYSFERDNCPPSDTLPFGGRGTHTNYTGMIWSGFRPSDDACKFGFHIPSNMFAVVVLGYIADIALQICQDRKLVARAQRLRAQIEFGIQTYGIVQHPQFGPIYAYETDGYGNYNLMDDANVPSLLSIPYLGYRPADDPIYRQTRAFVLSAANPYYYAGHFAQGIGSPHTPENYIWPISLAMQGLTATDSAEQTQLVEMLLGTTADTGYMHESFDVDDPKQFTRPWFAWANSLFGEFIYDWAIKS
jgi:meiotically up-regulated gene 157 (Mug157) protein